MDNNELINSNNSIIFEDTIKTNNHKIICRLINIGKMYRMILLENEQTISSIIFTKIDEEAAYAKIREESAKLWKQINK